MSLPSIRVRPAGPADRDQIWPLARALATSYVAEPAAFSRSFAALLADPAALILAAEPLGSEPTNISSPTDPKNLISHTSNTSHSGPDSLASPVSAGGELAGYLLATSHPAFHANGSVVWVEEVMVAEPARGCGVGRQLMAAAEDWGRQRGARYVALATRRAAPFYRALGYEDSAIYFKREL